MRVAILETGRPPGDLDTRHGRYDDMIRALLGPGHDYTTLDAVAGDLPDDPAAFDAYVITGSSAGVGDDLPWIEPLAAFLRRASGRAKLVGICFGHQIMAHAFGGRVERAAAGWGLGLHSYRVVARPDWADDAAAIAIPASHQDQVVAAPPDATVVAASAFTPFAALAYPERDAVSFQGHPEFRLDFAAELVRRNPAIAGESEAAALRSLAESNDVARVGRWINRFLESGRG